MRIAFLLVVTLAWTVDASAQCGAQGTPCDDGQFCTVADACDSGGACTGLPRACADTFACTTDSCNEATNTCDNLIASDQCLIAGICYAGGAFNPADACLICDPTLGSQVWSVATGRACDDGLFCTIDDACNGAAECRGRPRVCDDLLSCTSDHCNETANACESPQQTDTCLIGDLCYGSGLVNPENACEVCDASADATGWTPLEGVGCDDDLFCTVNDACDETGACTGAARACDDDDTCTLDSCAEDLARCEHAATETSCLIDQACVADGVANPANGCLGCDPATSTSAWTALAGEACDDGLFCTLGDTCSSSGACAGAQNPCDDDLACTLDHCDEEGDSCEHVLAPGTCLIDGACYASGQRSPDDPDQACDPAVDDDWSIVRVDAGVPVPEDEDDDDADESGCRLSPSGNAGSSTTLIAIALVLGWLRRRLRS
jgi:hypothetical protein